MSKYTRKKHIQDEDEFVSFWHHLFKKIEPYAAAIAITLASALVIIIATWAGANWVERRSQSATEAFDRVMKIYQADLVTADNPAKTDEDNPTPRYQTDKERAEATLAQLDAFDRKYGSADVSHGAVLLRAGILFDLARYDEAAAMYRKYLEHPPAAALAAVAREGIGLCDEARGKLDDALTEFKALEPKAGDFFRDRAWYDQARIYAKKGDQKKAAEIYKEILAKMPSTPLRDEIQSRLTLLEGP